MQKNWLKKLDIKLVDIPTAFTLLTRFPLSVDHAKAGQRAAKAAWVYPIVGGILGLFAGIIGLALSTIGVQSGMSAAIAIIALMLFTGGLHEDGLSDCVDGLGGGNTIQRRLEIMKDSRIGAFGAAALCTTILARWAGYNAIINVDWLWAFIAVGAASRLPMVLVMYGMPLARHGGLAATVGLVTAPTAIIAIVITLILCVASIGMLALPTIAIAVIAGLPLCYLAWRRIEGYTGDILGGCQQIGEIAALATITIIL